MNGIDVSGWQPGNITDLVDYDFVIIKATEGIGFVSNVCDKQYQLAKKRNKLLGVYHFATGLDARAEADFFVKNIQGYLGEAILVLDWEAGAVNRGREWVRTFVRRVKELTGVPPIIYGSQSPLTTQNIKGIAQDENCGLWVAAYPNNNQTGYRNEGQLLGSIIRQYSSYGRLAGYNGNLDLNRSILTPETWKKYAKGNRVDTPAPTPASEPTPVVPEPAEPTVPTTPDEPATTVPENNTPIDITSTITEEQDNTNSPENKNDTDTNSHDDAQVVGASFWQKLIDILQAIIKFLTTKKGE